MSRPIRIGVQLWPGGTPGYASWRDAVLRAEDLGADIVFGYDHFHKPFVQRTSEGPRLLPEQADVNNFEAWTALASWAEVTSSAEIGTLVTGMGYRNPDLLADMARTVDHISGGRLILGVGAGWYEKDYTVYGYNYGTVKSRMDLFAEGLERVSSRLKLLKPQPVRDIPILVGGAGERKTLPLVGRYASIWHSSLELETFRRKNDLVRKYAAEAGRDEALIERAVTWPGDGQAGASTEAEQLARAYEQNAAPGLANAGWVAVATARHARGDFDGAERLLWKLVEDGDEHVLPDIANLKLQPIPHSSQRVIGSAGHPAAESAPIDYEPLTVG